MYGYGFLSGGKDSGVKLRTLLRLLSGQVFPSHFGELCLAWSHGGGITSGMSYIEIAVGQSELGAVAWWAFVIGAAASTKAVWWDGYASCKPADALVIPPYGSMEGYLVYCVFLSFCHFVCMVTDFSAAEKKIGA